MEPIAGVIIGPNGGNDTGKIPNEDSVDFELDDTNIRSSNRFTGLDRVEGGPRAYYGLKTSFYETDLGRASAFLGQSFRVRDDSTFKEGSGLDGNFSDFVGRVEVSHPKYFSLLYRFRIENEDFNIKRNEVRLTAGLPVLRISANYLFVDQEDQGSFESFEDREEIALRMSSRVLKRLSVGANTRRHGHGVIERPVSAITGICVDVEPRTTVVSEEIWKYDPPNGEPFGFGQADQHFDFK